MILQAVSGESEGTRLISVDEKTGIQALGRKTETSMGKGADRRIEAEYSRHGTTCLMAAFDVAGGAIMHHRTGPTRKEPDFLCFIQQCVEKIPEGDKAIFLLDQLNTHMSESLVIWVAGQLGDAPNLGVKGYKGILKDKKTRMAFLEDPRHRIRFVFTPKHCSWLNPVENWFAKLQTHIIKYGNFNSVGELEARIAKYVGFNNACLARPLNWTFKGFVKSHQLYGLKLRA